MRENSRQVRVNWTPNKVTLLRVAVGFLAVGAFGHGAWMNLLGVALTVGAVALDALDGHMARRKKIATPVGAQLDILGDRIIENMFFTYFAVVGMVSLWLPMLFFTRGAATDFLRGLAMKAGHSGWGTNAMLQSSWAKALVASRWSRGLYAAMKCVCFCYLGLELALTRGPVALLGPVSLDMHAAIRAGAQTLAWMTGAFCVARGLPVLVEGWRFLAGNFGGGKCSRRGGGRHGMSGDAHQEKRAAAFFDIDGTLVPDPPLEVRMFHALRRGSAIPLMNYARWSAEALRLLPRGLAMVAQGNKRYLHGLRVEQIFEAMETIAFFEEGIARVEWHAKRGDQIVLVSGMIKPLARMVAIALECELEARGLEREVFVSATRLQERSGAFTGRVLGEANFGETKKKSIGIVASALQVQLRESHAYGNKLHDLPMLRAVGHAHAVNPGRELAQAANLSDWPIWHWHHEKKFASENSAKEKVKLQMIGTHP